MQNSSDGELGASGASATSRNCGSCTLCCKVYDVPAVDSLAGAWCRHCKPGQGCAIWDSRPEQCRAFNCLWLSQEWLGPEWKPERAKIVFTMDSTGKFLQFQVDPGSPNAWKRQPYYGHLKNWSAEALQRGQFVVVFINKAATLVLPDREVALGALGAGDQIVVNGRPNGSIDVEVRRG